MIPSLSALNEHFLCVSGALTEDGRRDAENDRLSKQECARAVYCQDPAEAEVKGSVFGSEDPEPSAPPAEDCSDAAVVSPPLDPWLLTMP